MQEATTDKSVISLCFVFSDAILWWWVRCEGAVWGDWRHPAEPTSLMHTKALLPLKETRLQKHFPEQQMHRSWNNSTYIIHKRTQCFEGNLPDFCICEVLSAVLQAKTFPKLELYMQWASSSQRKSYHQFFAFGQTLISLKRCVEKKRKAF